MRSKDKIDASASPLLVAALAVNTLEQVTVANRLPLGAHVEEVDEEVIGQDTRALGQDTVR